MSMRYKGGVISATAPTITPPVDGEGGTASGVWTLETQFQNAASWPKPTIFSQLWAWGKNSRGQLGLGNTTYYSSPKQVGALTDWKSISSSGNSTLFVRKNGTLWAVGWNVYGQLGTGNVTDYSSPKQVGALTNWASVCTGLGLFTLAIKTNGTLWAWGINSSGQLGLGNTTYFSSPNQVGALTNWASVTAGQSNAVAIKTDGTLWTWGSNGSGQLGLGNITYFSSPKQVGALTNWSKAACIGYYGVLAVKTDGTLWAWGQNTFGMLGLNNTSNYSSPKQVGTLTDWLQVAGGQYFASAVKTDGTLWSWGYGGTFRTGLGNATSYSSPKQVGVLTNWLSVACGYAHGAAINLSGNLYAWGMNSDGQLGLGDTSYRSSPVQVGALSTWTKLPNSMIGAYSTHAIKTP